ncbi:hypothetical protein Tco_1419097 [Tanacetum coccineum]
MEQIKGREFKNVNMEESASKPFVVRTTNIGFSTCDGGSTYVIPTECDGDAIVFNIVPDVLNIAEIFGVPFKTFADIEDLMNGIEMGKREAIWSTLTEERRKDVMDSMFTTWKRLMDENPSVTSKFVEYDGRPHGVVNDGFHLVVNGRANFWNSYRSSFLDILLYFDINRKILVSHSSSVLPSFSSILIRNVPDTAAWASSRSCSELGETGIPEPDDCKNSRSSMRSWVKTKRDARPRARSGRLCGPGLGDVSNESWSVDVLLEKLGWDGVLVYEWSGSGLDKGDEAAK